MVTNEFSQIIDHTVRTTHTILKYANMNAMDIMNNCFSVSSVAFNKFLD